MNQTNNQMLQEINQWIHERNWRQRLNWCVENETLISFTVKFKWAAMPWTFLTKDGANYDEHFVRQWSLKNKALLFELISPTGTQSNLNLNCVSGYSTSALYNSTVCPVAGQAPQPYTLMCANTVGEENEPRIFIRVTLPCRFITRLHSNKVAPASALGAQPTPIEYRYWGPYYLTELLELLWPDINAEAETFMSHAFKAASTFDLQGIHRNIQVIAKQMLTDYRIIEYINMLEALMFDIQTLEPARQKSALASHIEAKCGKTTESQHLINFATTYLLPSFHHEIIVNRRFDANTYIQKQLTERGLSFLSNIYYASRYKITE